jgi:pyruvate dehydrogenase E1 component beta subunit
MAIPGLKVVAPSTPADVLGLMAASIRDNDPVVFCAHKALFATKGVVPDGEHVDTLGTARVLREGSDASLVALAAMVPKALQAADRLQQEDGLDVEVLDLRCLVPLDTQALLATARRTSRVFTVEENPRLCGWGAEVASILAEEAFHDLDTGIVRITTPHIPLPSAAALEDLAIPSVERIVDTVRHTLGRT